MTEKEKMLRQMLYDANNDTDLIEERKAAKDLCYDFNHLRPSDTIGQQRIMHHRCRIDKFKGIPMKIMYL